MSDEHPLSAAVRARGTKPPERFWPYAGMSEIPSDAELDALDPDLRTALFGLPPRPFSVTLVFGRFDGPGYERAVTLARRAPEYEERDSGTAVRHSARFFAAEALALRDLFEVVGAEPGTDVLINDRALPYARELWLPLVWFLLMP